MGKGDNDKPRIPSAGWTSIPELEAIEREKRSAGSGHTPGDDGDVLDPELDEIHDLGEFDLRLDTISANIASVEGEIPRRMPRGDSWVSGVSNVGVSERPTAEYEEAVRASSHDEIARPAGDPLDAEDLEMAPVPGPEADPIVVDMDEPYEDPYFSYTVEAGHEGDDGFASEDAHEEPPMLESGLLEPVELDRAALPPRYEDGGSGDDPLVLGAIDQALDSGPGSEGDDRTTEASASTSSGPAPFGTRRDNSSTSIVGAMAIGRDDDPRDVLAPLGRRQFQRSPIVPLATYVESGEEEAAGNDEETVAVERPFAIPSADAIDDAERGGEAPGEDAGAGEYGRDYDDEETVAVERPFAIPAADPIEEDEAGVAAESYDEEETVAVERPEAFVEDYATRGSVDSDSDSGPGSALSEDVDVEASNSASGASLPRGVVDSDSGSVSSASFAEASEDSDSTSVSSASFSRSASISASSSRSESSPWVSASEDELERRADSPSHDDITGEYPKMPLPLGADAPATDDDTVAVQRPSPSARSTEVVEVTDAGAATAPTITVPEIEGGLPTGSGTWVTEFDRFREEVLKLGVSKRWRRLAAVTAWAAVNAPYATGATRTALLLDLARVYRDRIKDDDRAEEAFVAAIADEPENAEALSFLEERRRARGDLRGVYDLYFRAVPATWDPDDRMAWTRIAAELATRELGDASLAMEAWQQLWSLSGPDPEVAGEIARSLRAARRWSELAEFLEAECERETGASRTVALRELAEVQAWGVGDWARAATTLRKIAEQDPDDPLVVHQLTRLYAATEDWDALSVVASSSRGDAREQFTRRHHVASVLWEAGEHDRAMHIYERLLAEDPTDSLAQLRVEERQRATGDYAALVASLVARADAGEDDERSASFVLEAAQLTREELGDRDAAIALFERHRALVGDDLDSARALAELYDEAGQTSKIADALEVWQLLETDPGQRLEVLRRLAKHLAGDGSDPERAERIWRDILTIEPGDEQARASLTDLYRARGDYEALDSTLNRQIALASGADRALELSRLAAENADANLEDAERSIRAWRRVLDYAPGDVDALRALGAHFEQAGDHRRRAATLEEQIARADDDASRAELGVRIAEVWSEGGAHRSAAASLERVLAREPRNTAALDALVKTFTQAGRTDLALATLDGAVAGIEDRTERARLVRRTIELLPEDALEAAEERWRRVLTLAPNDADAMAALEEVAGLRGQAFALECVRSRAVANASSDDERRAATMALAAHLEGASEAPERAAAVLLAALWSGADGDEDLLANLDALRGKTARHEELLALLERRAALAPREESRREDLRRCATILADEVGEPRRALDAMRRIVEVRPDDEEVLDAAVVLATVSGLWRDCAALLRAASDAAASHESRASIARRIENLARENGDARLAHEALVEQVRLERTDENLRSRLLESAMELGDVPWSMTVLEGSALAALPESIDELVAVASLCENEAGEPERAVDLLILALTTEPTSAAVVAELRRLAEATGAREEVADALRRAAALCDDDVAVEHLRTAAGLLGDTPGAVEVHRRILELRDDERPSLEVMIAHHREREQWHDLRDRLLRWVELSDDREASKQKLLEIGRISEEQLGDVRRALDAYARVLALDAEDVDARARTEALVQHLDDPRLRLSFLRGEVERTSGPAKVGLELEIATLLETRMDDIEGATSVLRGIVEREGVTSPAFERLVSALAESGLHEERVALQLERAEAAESDGEKCALLRSVLDDVSAAAELGPEREEAVYRALLELDPSDAGLQRRFSQFLRDREQYSELAHVLSSLAESLDDPVERAELQRERARLLACNLESPQEARATWDQLAAVSRDDSASRLAIAGTCLQSGDIDGYVSWRTEASSELPPREAALVLCHLAEALDEADAPEGRITGLYRQARQLDAACEPAREALKGIGRRRKDLRPEAALLPEDGEKQMPWSARAERMRMRAEAELTHDVAAAVEWLLRAVVTDMDDVAAWDALAEALESTGDRDGAYRARVGALEAIRRTRPLSAAGADEEAGRLLAIASAARAVGSPEEYERIIRRVHAVAPGHAPTALALASIVLERGEHEVARDTLDTLLSRYRERIPDSQLAQVHTVRARTYLAAGDADAAAEDFRNAIALSPLDRGALSEYATLLSERGQFAESIEHRIRALVVAAEPSTRAELHFALGLDWEDGLGAPNEAGVCFEHAWEEGLRSRALDQRLLGHFHRTGQVERGLAVIDGLLDSASEPGEMARLWMSRGEIFASSEGREDEAIEAFDMALSYDPDLNAARSALARVLERRGDWDGLLEILEAIAESDAGPADERAAATLEMARVASERLGDDARAMELVRAANDLSPSVEATRLEADLLGRTEHGSEAHLEALARLVALGPPWFEPAFSLGELVLDAAPSWGWCLLSPALVVRGVDDQLKAGLKGMRRDYERPPIRVVPEEELAADWPEELRGLRDVLSELVAIVPVGAQSIAELDDGDVATVSVHSNIGRTFLAVAEAFGVEGASVHRGGALVEPVGIAGGPDEAAVIIRADIFQQLSRAELGFALAYSLDLASPGSRALSASKAGSRSAVVRGLWGALGFAESRGDAAEIEAKIRDAVDPEGLEAWGARVANLSGESPSSVAERYWKAVRLRAMRAGLLAGADLTQVIRLVARMETDLERPALFEDADALDSYVAQVPLLGALVAFAASPRFGRWIAEAREV